MDSDNSQKVVVTRSEFVLEDNKLQADIVYTRRTQQEKRINRTSQLSYLLSTRPLPPAISKKTKKELRNKRLVNFVHLSGEMHKIILWNDPLELISAYVREHHTNEYFI